MKQAYTTDAANVAGQSDTGQQQQQQQQHSNLTNLQQATPITNGRQSIDHHQSHQLAINRHQHQQQQQQQQQHQQQVQSKSSDQHQAQQQQVTTTLLTQNARQENQSNRFTNNSTSNQQQQTAHGSSNTTNPGSNGNSSLRKELPANGKKTKGRVRINMEFIHSKLRRLTTFSKRKTGIMKKAKELAILTGTQLMLAVASETGHVYTFATERFLPLTVTDAGQALIANCLNSDIDYTLMSRANGTSSSCKNEPQQQPSNPSPMSNASAASSASSGSSSTGSSTAVSASCIRSASSPTSWQMSPSSNNNSNYRIGCISRTFSTKISSAPTQARSAPNSENHTSNVADAHSDTTSKNISQTDSTVLTSQDLVASQSGTVFSDDSAQQHQQNESERQRLGPIVGFEDTDMNFTINDELNDRVSLATSSPSDSIMSLGKSTMSNSAAYFPHEQPHVYML